VAVPPPSPPRISFVIDEEGGVKDDDVPTPFCLLLINARCLPLARLRGTDDAIDDEVDLLPSTDTGDVMKKRANKHKDFILSIGTINCNLIF